jgi:hypothetical protein
LLREKLAGTQPPEALQLGIPADRWGQFIHWCYEKQDVDIGYPDTFYSLAAARRALGQFFPQQDDLLLVGIGLHRERLVSFLENHYTIGQQYGVYQVLDQKKALDTGGEVVGLDILGYESGINHSWLCYNFERKLDSDLDIQPNTLGLMATAQEADLVAAYAAQVAPGWGWLPWVVVRYPLVEDK